MTETTEASARPRWIVGHVPARGQDVWHGTVTGLSEEDMITAQQITARISSRNPPHRGATVRLTIDPERVHLFSVADGRRLSEPIGS